MFRDASNSSNVFGQISKFFNLLLIAKWINLLQRFNSTVSTVYSTGYCLRQPYRLLFNLGTLCCTEAVLQSNISLIIINSKVSMNTQTKRNCWIIIISWKEASFRIVPCANATENLGYSKSRNNSHHYIIGTKFIPTLGITLSQWSISKTIT